MLLFVKIQYFPVVLHRFTVFRSELLPLTVVNTEEAEAFYEDYLGSDLLSVPVGNLERLQQWPKLEPKDLRTYGKGDSESCADVVLSNAGEI